MFEDKRRLLVLVVLLVLAGYFLWQPLAVAGAGIYGTTGASAETPYGEKLEIEIGSGAETSGEASMIQQWTASYQDSESQQVYEVDDVYKSQEQVTLSYSLTVTHANVESIAATVKIKAIETTLDHEYALATNKALSGVSPISDSGQTQRTILEHLGTDIGCSTDSATVQYQIYAQVTATGSISGDTLTATVAYTQFGELSYVRSTESSAAEITPQIQVASNIEKYLGLPGQLTLSIVAVGAVAAAVWLWRREP
jgi:hypothetical protein